MAVSFPSYEQWRKLKPAQRDYLMWSTLSGVSNLNSRFAGKWIERAMYTVGGLVIAFIVNGVLNGTFTKQ